VTALLVVLGAMVGAPVRYLVDRAIQARHTTAFPWGTFVVYVSGCLVLGAVAGLGSASPAYALVGTGFCGALTTYSTFSFENFRLVEQRSYFYAGMNVLVSVVAGVGGAAVAYLAVR
jgi:CrcB protein